MKEFLESQLFVDLQPVLKVLFVLLVYLVTIVLHVLIILFFTCRNSNTLPSLCL